MECRFHPDVDYLRIPVMITRAREVRFRPLPYSAALSPTSRRLSTK